MSRTTDAGLFFQTESSLEATQRRSAKSSNTAGDPIKLPSKILAVIPDPVDLRRIYVAESAATARRVVLDTKLTSHVYRGPAAPVSCLALSPNHTTLFAGCWDKSIWSWDTETRKPGPRYQWHTDFLKAVLCIRVRNAAGDDGSHEDLLISGGADAAIVIWSLRTNAKLHVLKGHTRGILDLAIAPSAAWRGATPTAVILFSAGSDREIRRWKVALGEAAELDSVSPILVHETSVNRLRFVTDEDGNGETELWTASSDKTAKCSASVAARDGGASDLSVIDVWEEDTSLLHPDFVRDVVVDETHGVVVTACRDEEVRVWSKVGAELLHTYSGHFEEVTGLALIGDSGEPQSVVSVSIDGTIRQWNVGKDGLSRAKEDERRRIEGEDGSKEANNESAQKDGMVGTKLTEDEERELAELMEEEE